MTTPRAFEHSTAPDVSDPDIKAAKRAQHHTRNGHMQKTARVLHSTAAMADLRQPQVRDAVAALHPGLPPTSVIPPLPDSASQQILEDDEVMETLLQSSDNGSASGPSGWGGNMLSSFGAVLTCADWAS